MAQHRHQRHEAGAVPDKQQRSAIVNAPGERAADGTAQLQLVCDAKHSRQVRRNLPVIDRSVEIEATVVIRRPVRPAWDAKPTQ